MKSTLSEFANSEWPLSTVNSFLRTNINGVSLPILEIFKNDDAHEGSLASRKHACANLSLEAYKTKFLAYCISRLPGLLKMIFNARKTTKTPKNIVCN